MRFAVGGVVAGVRSGAMRPAAVLAGVVAGLAFVLCGPVAGAWASSSCPNEVFRTGVGANLPDCRAYELVSPPDKNGGAVEGGLDFYGEPAPYQAAADGEAVTYGSQTTFTEANPESSTYTNQYLSRRGPDGWSTKAVSPRWNPGPHVPLEVDDLVQGFSEDLSRSFTLAGEPAPVAGAPTGVLSPYLRDDEDGALTLLSAAVPQTGELEQAQLQVEYAGMSADGTHVIFASNEALTSNAIPGEINLYEWSPSGLELMSVLPDGKAYSGGGTEILEANDPLGFGGPAKRTTEGRGGEGGGAGSTSNYSHAISVDGTRVFWSAPGGQVYMSESLDNDPRSVEISHGLPAAHYWTASADGSVVYLTSEHVLYQYDVDTGVLRDLTVGENVGEAAGVQGVLGASEDGSYVYFAATGKLAAGAPTAQAEKYNVYVWHEGATSFIATLGSGLEERSGFVEALKGRTSRVSPDGGYLAFQSEEPLTGYDNLPVNREACQTYRATHRGTQSKRYASPSGRCMEVYEYSAATGSLVCVSCNPSGLPPVGDSEVPGDLHGFGEVFTGWQSATLQQRYLTNDGRLFFTSEDVLLPQASDGVQNVYEYEPAAVGSCASTGGCVSLISSGTSNQPSYFVDASADGNDAFFLTTQQLVGLDGDEVFDVYDARVGGGFEAPAVPPCDGEACRPPITPAPAIYQAPPSATFQGAGNAAPVEPVLPKPTTVKQKAKKKTKAKGKRETKAKRRHQAAQKASKASGGEAR